MRRNTVTFPRAFREAAKEVGFILAVYLVVVAAILGAVGIGYAYLFLLQNL